MESGLQETERAYLSTLYSSYSEQIRKFVFSRLHNEMITEDVVQNTFVWACINVRPLRTSANAGSLLLTYARKLTMNMFKEMTNKIDFPYHYIGDVDSGNGSVDIGLDEFFTNDLAEDERRMLHLRYEQDASVADIAKQIGISEFATKRKLKIAVRKLKTGLQFGQDLPTHPLSPEELLLFKAAEKDPTLAKLIIETADRAGFVRPEKVILLNDLVDMAGDPLKHDANDSFVHHVISVNQCLTDKVIEDPDFLYKMTSRQFEEFVAEMLEKKGYSVHITPATRDGGKDVIIAKQDFFSYLFYVECKKYAPEHHVGIDIIQRLYGVISAEHATGGIIATTSSFTRDAKDYIHRHNLSRQISLQDYDNIIKSLQELK